VTSSLVRDLAPAAIASNPPALRRDNRQSETPAPPPAGERDDAGVLLSVLLDGRKGVSFLLALDAGSLRELARAEVPHHIPFGFHGQFARGLTF
jgi:carotenoid cleavage dioxygenase-like enzyme